MESIKVSSCRNCPFNYLEFTPESNSYDSYELCALQEFKDKSPSLIIAYMSCETPVIIKTPDWCPLDEINIKKEN